MRWTTTTYATLALTLFLGASALAQIPRNFLTGRCPSPDSLSHPDLSQVVDEPAHRPTLLTVIMTGSKSLVREDIQGRVTLAAVVDTVGRIIPGTLMVMTSNDTEMSKWICYMEKRIIFRPATDSTGKPVVAQVTMPYSITLIGK